MKKSYILFGLTIGLITLIPLPVQAEETAEKIAEMVGAMTWCKDVVANNSWEKSNYQNAIDEGNKQVKNAIRAQNIDRYKSRDIFNKLAEVERAGEYEDRVLNLEECQNIKNKLLGSN